MIHGGNELTDIEIHVLNILFTNLDILGIINMNTYRWGFVPLNYIDSFRSNFTKPKSS